MTTVYLGLGSNVGDREGFIGSALEQLGAGGVRIVRVSPFYETEPQGFTEQAWFLNAVAEAETALLPLALLERIEGLEAALQRRRTVVNGPRTIDVDIVLFGDVVMRTKELEIPHPRYRERRFVLAPLADLVPELRDPVTGQTVAAMLAQVVGQAIHLAQ